MRISTKVRLGFVLMLGITLAVSGVAVWSIRQLADMNSQLYDRTLMSSTYAQSALAGFRKLQLLAGQAATPGTAFTDAEQIFLGDLSVVESRTLTAAERAIVERVRGLLKSWRARVSGQPNAAEIVEASRPIEEELTALTEAAAAAGFESREAATALGRRTLAVTATLAAAALVLATAASLLVARVLVRPVVLIASHVDGITDGDLTRRIMQTGRDEIGQLATGVNRMVQALHDGMAQLSTVAVSAATLSERLQSSSAELTGGAQIQAASLQETAASLEQMTATVSQSAEHAREARAMAERTSTTAADGQRVALTAVEAMAEIARASGRITEVTATVDELAFQTNLLALNAAVEAARAGDHGLGFAVVAAEVRNLARRSADAAREIKRLIQDSVTKVQTGGAVVTSTCERLESIVASTAKVSDLIAAIAASSQEHALGIDQVNRAVSDIERVTQRNAQQTDALTAVAQELATQAATLRELVGRYTVEVETQEIPAAAEEPGRRPSLWEPAEAEVPELTAR